MPNSLKGFTQDPTYERFLGASVGEDQRGFEVSVLSMLARLDLDPWVEAAELSALSDAPLRQRLERRLEAFPDLPLTGPSRLETVSRLMTLLPERKRLSGMSADGKRRTFEVPSVGLQIFWGIATVFAIGYLGAMAQGG